MGVDRIAPWAGFGNSADSRQMPTRRPTVSSGDVALRMVDCIRLFRPPSPYLYFLFRQCPTLRHTVPFVT